MTLQKWVQDPIILGNDPIFTGSWRLQALEIPAIFMHLIFVGGGGGGGHFVNPFFGEGDIQKNPEPRGKKEQATTSQPLKYMGRRKTDCFLQPPNLNMDGVVVKRYISSAKWEKVTRGHLGSQPKR